MEKRHRCGLAVLPHMLVPCLWVTLHVSAAPAAVSRPERSDRVSEEAQYPPFWLMATGRTGVTYLPKLKAFFPRLYIIQIGEAYRFFT